MGVHLRLRLGLGLGHPKGVSGFLHCFIHYFLFGKFPIGQIHFTVAFFVYFANFSIRKASINIF